MALCSASRSWISTCGSSFAFMKSNTSAMSMVAGMVGVSPTASSSRFRMLIETLILLNLSLLLSNVIERPNMRAPLDVRLQFADDDFGGFFDLGFQVDLIQEGERIGVFHNVIPFRLWGDL